MTDKRSKDTATGTENKSIMSTGSRKQYKNSKNKDKIKDKQKTKVNKGSNSMPKGKNAKRKGMKNWSLKKKILMSILGLILLFIVVCGIYATIVIIKTPSIEPSNIYSYLSETSTLYDAKGKAIENVFVADGNRTNVDYKNMPKDLVNAIVAIEDKTFWDHHGFNFIRMLGAIKDSVSGGGQISGTSTITQQLARNVYLSAVKSERTMSRKISEAYYTTVLEKNLTKEQIVEAYLNTIYLGYGAYGAETASKTYFSKELKDLDTLECAALAAIPQLPDTYALVKKVSATSVDKSDPDFLYSDGTTAYIYNGEASKNRRETTLRNMQEQGYISKSELNKLLKEDLRDHMKLNKKSLNSYSSYFTDYVIEEVAQDIMDQNNYSYADARDMIYTGGLKIYTTMDSKAQSIVEKEFKENYNFPAATNLITDSNGNVLDKYGAIILYDYDDLFDSRGIFTLYSDEFKKNSDGSLLLKKDNHLNFYETESNGTADISVEFKPTWLYVDGVFHTIESGALTIPSKYKTKESNGNVIISADFFKDYPDYFIESGSNLKVKKKNYTIKQKITQPQSAMVIINNKTGGIAAMVGGRNTEGKMLYNRADSPRQPGSSIKPLAIYSSALQMGADAAANGQPMSYSGSDTDYYGNYLTAGSSINDAPIGSSNWPKNWYEGYKGYQTMRVSVEQSINVNAVRMFTEVGADYATSQLKKFGITSVVEDGDVNDQNPAALALGGMSKGISPLEMASAYTTFPNEGIHKDSKAYTKVANRKGEILLKKEQNETKVLDAGVAFIATDILRTTVTKGIASNAGISSAPVAGKTGTTSDNYDMWFAGCTPKYSAALWIGNDVNIELTGTSDIAASLWGNIMEQVCSGLTWQDFPSAPDNVSQNTISGVTEYFINGTQPDSIHQSSEKKKDKDKEKEKEKKTEEPTDSTEPTEPTEPTAPTDPTVPTDPTSPTNPTSVNSFTSVNPINPAVSYQNSAKTRFDLLSYLMDFGEHIKAII